MIRPQKREQDWIQAIFAGEKDGLASDTAQSVRQSKVSAEEDLPMPIHMPADRRGDSWANGSKVSQTALQDGFHFRIQPPNSRVCIYIYIYMYIYIYIYIYILHAPFLPWRLRGLDMILDLLLQHRRYLDGLDEETRASVIKRYIPDEPFGGDAAMPKRCGEGGWNIHKGWREGQSPAKESMVPGECSSFMFDVQGILECPPKESMKVSYLCD